MSQETANVHPEDAGLVTGFTDLIPAKQRLIVGFFRDAADKVFPVHGVERVPFDRDYLAERMELIKFDALVARRERLETDPAFRHPIPYILIHRHREDGELEFFLYQRTKLIGEEKLFGKYSIAVGGHPEAPSIRFFPDWTFNLAESLLACVVSELDEEVTFNGLSFSEYSAGGSYTYAHEGFIRDDSDKVGLQHIGILCSVGIPSGVEVITIEDELVTVGFKTLAELDAEGAFDLENWSRLVITNTIEVITEAKAAAAAEQAAIDALPKEEPVVGRGMTASIVHRDEEMYLGEVGDEDQSWRQRQLEASEAKPQLLTNPDGTYLIVDEAVFKTVLPGDESGNQFSLTHNEDGTVLFTVDPHDPDPLATIEFLIGVFNSTIVDGVQGIDTAEAQPVDLAEFAAEVTGADVAAAISERGLSAGPNGDWKPYNPAEVDPSAETQVLTELHREVGTTDEQMQQSVELLTKISNDVAEQADADEVKVGDSDKA